MKPSILAQWPLMRYKRCRAQDVHRLVKVHVQASLIAMGDRALLHQAIKNLIKNAWKFTSPAANAEIWVGQSADDGVVMTTFFVRDNGTGFDMVHSEKIFGTFRCLHSPREFSGTGMGLATINRIVSRHRGRIWAL